MDIGVVHGGRILDQEYFQVFRIMGKAVHQGFDEEAVLDMDHFIIMEWDLQTFIVEDLPLDFNSSPRISLL